MAVGSDTTAIKAPESNAQTCKERQLVLLCIVLQALHILFGVTAIIGVLVTPTRSNITLGNLMDCKRLIKNPSNYISSRCEAAA